MLIADWLAQSEHILKEASVPTARLDCELLVADILDKDRSWLHAHPEHVLKAKQISELNAKIIRRSQHEPIAYIRGKQEFYGRDFIVSPDTLTPRPETEAMIDLLLKTIDAQRLKLEKDVQIIDVGTGSGCIVITAALELVRLSSSNYPISFLGLDISKSTLKIAQINAQNLKAAVQFQQFDLRKDPLDLQPSTCSVVLANLPYVPDDFRINLAATHEPSFAIFGGSDGLDYYRQLFAQLSLNSPRATHPLLVFTESMPPQHSALQDIAYKAGFNSVASSDFIQVFEFTKNNR